MKVNIKDLQGRYWPVLGYLPQSLLKDVRLIYVLGLVGRDVLLVTNDDRVLFYGLNQNLISSRPHDCCNVIEIKELSHKRIKGFACNSQHSSHRNDLTVVSYLMNGEVYIWGCNPSVDSIITAPSLVGELPETVKKVACGYSHYLALTSDEMVYAWGDNEYGQTAWRDETQPTVFQPRRISFPFGDIADIACGSHFSVVLTRKHKVFGWGKNSNGQLGEEIGSSYGPIIRELSMYQNIGIRKIACGDCHILALNDCGALFSSGNNSCKQLFASSDDTPVRFKEIAASGYSSLGETLDGDILIWGFLDDGNIHAPMKTPCRSMNEAFALYHLGGMYEPIEVASESENVAETVAESVRRSFGDPETSDLKIIVQEKEILVHKSVLAIRSKYFERMFANNWSEEKTSCIKMDESYGGISAFLKYLYTDELDNVDLKVLVDVAIIAEKYCELNLVNLCLKQFESGLNQSNVAELYELTLDQRLSNFNELCVDYATLCLSTVVASSAYNTWNLETFKSFFQHDKIKSILTTSN